jgi:hypothetical protein
MMAMKDGGESSGTGTESDDLTGLVRDGVRPEGKKERLQLAADKMLGHVPLGVDARSKSLRKGIAGSAELLALLKYGFLGLPLVVFGILFLYFGLRGEFDVRTLGIGACLLPLGIWSLRAAYRAGRNLRAISKA